MVDLAQARGRPIQPVPARLYEEPPPTQPQQLSPDDAQQIGPDQPRYRTIQFEGKTYRFDARQYNEASIRRWLETMVSERQVLTPERAGGRTTHRDSAKAKRARQAAPLGEEGRRELAEFLSGTDAAGNRVTVGPEDVTPQVLEQLVPAWKQYADMMEKNERVNPVWLREYREDIANVEADLGRWWSDIETSQEFHKRQAVAQGRDPAQVKGTPSAAWQDRLVIQKRLAKFNAERPGRLDDETNRQYFSRLLAGMADEEVVGLAAKLGLDDADTPNTARGAVLHMRLSERSPEQITRDREVRKAQRASLPPEELQKRDELRVQAYLALTNYNDRRALLNIIRAIPKEDLPLFVEEVGLVGEEFEDYRPGFWRRLAAAPGRGVFNLAQYVAETIGIGGTDEEMIIANRIRQVEASIHGARETDPWVQWSILQAAEQAPYVAAMIRSGQLYGLPGIMTAVFPQSYRQADLAMAAKGIDAYYRKPMAFLIALAVGRLEDIIRNPFAGPKGGKATLMSQLVNVATHYAIRFPLEWSEEFAQGAADQLGQVIAGWLDERAPNEHLGSVFAESWKQGMEAFGPLVVLMGAPATIQMPLMAEQGAEIERQRQAKVDLAREFETAPPTLAEAHLLGLVKTPADIALSETSDAKIARFESRLAELQAVGEKGYVSEQEGRDHNIPGKTRSERKGNLRAEEGMLKQAIKEIRDASPIPETQREVWKTPSGKDVRGAGQDKVRAQPAGEGAKAQAQIPLTLQESLKRARGAGLSFEQWLLSRDGKRATEKARGDTSRLRRLWDRVAAQEARPAQGAAAAQRQAKPLVTRESGAVLEALDLVNSEQVTAEDLARQLVEMDKEEGADTKWFETPSDPEQDVENRLKDIEGGKILVWVGADGQVSGLLQHGIDPNDPTNARLYDIKTSEKKQPRGTGRGAAMMDAWLSQLQEAGIQTAEWQGGTADATNWFTGYIDRRGMENRTEETAYNAFKVDVGQFTLPEAAQQPTVAAQPPQAAVKPGLAPEAVQASETTPKLGLERVEVIDPSLELLTDDEFQNQRMAVTARVDVLEKTLDQVRNSGADLSAEFIDELVAAQDAYSAFENEHYRRRMAEISGEDIAHQLVMGVTPTQRQILRRIIEDHPEKALILQSLLDYAMRSPDHAESVAGILDDFRHDLPETPQAGSPYAPTKRPLRKSQAAQPPQMALEPRTRPKAAPAAETPQAAPSGVKQRTWTDYYAMTVAELKSEYARRPGLPPYKGRNKTVMVQWLIEDDRKARAAADPLQQQPDDNLRFGFGPGAMVPIAEPGRLGRAVGRFFQKFFTTRGELPADVYQAKVRKEGRVAKEMAQLQFAARDLGRAVRAAWGSAELFPEDAEQINAVLRNEDDPATIPKEIRAPVQAMRDHIDALSRALIAAGVAQGDLVGIITQNLGIYVTRSYQVFDDPNWRHKVPEGIRNRAIAEVRNMYPHKSDAEVIGIVESLLFRGAAESPMTLLKGSKLGSKDLSIFMKRKAIPKWLRDLWGEYKHPGINYARSVFKMAHLLANHQFLEEVRKAGEGKWLRTAEEGPIVNEYGEVIARIAAEGSSVMAPLNGMYTTPEIKQAFEELDSPGAMPDWLRPLIAANYVVKYGKTVLSPMTHVRNFVSNSGFAIANAHWQLNKAGKAIWAEATGMFALPDAEYRRRYARYAELKIVGEDVREGELRDALRDASKMNMDDFLYGQPQRAGAWMMNTLRGGYRLLNTFYQAEDAVWKIYAFENEKARYRKAFPGWSEDQLERHCAEIVRDTFPTYSKIPAGIKALRRFPLIGTFVSFPSEVVRTQFNTLALALKEVQNPRTMAIGAQRMAGSIVSLGIANALAQGVMAALGIGRDEDDDLRWFVPPWQENSQLLYTAKPESATYRFVDLGYSDPHAYLTDPLVAMSRGKDWKDSLWKGTVTFLEPFTSEEILWKALADLRSNEGNKIYNPRDTVGQQAKDMVSHLWTEALEPGGVSSLRRIYEAITGRNPNREVSTEILAVTTGQRFQKVDVEHSLGFRVRDFGTMLTEIHRIPRKTALSRGRATGERIATDLARMEKIRLAAFAEMQQIIGAARRLGVPEKNIAALLEGELPDDVAKEVMTGDYSPYQMTPQTVRQMMEANPKEFAERFAGWHGEKTPQAIRAYATPRVGNMPGTEPKREKGQSEEDHAKAVEKFHQGQAQIKRELDLLGVSHDEAVVLLTEYYRRPRDDKPQTELVGNRRSGNYDPSYAARAEALDRLYGQPAGAWKQSRPPFQTKPARKQRPSR